MVETMTHGMSLLGSNERSTGAYYRRQDSVSSGIQVLQHFIGLGWWPCNLPCLVSYAPNITLLSAFHYSPASMLYKDEDSMARPL
jgi:hypothetical protein